MIRWVGTSALIAGVGALLLWVLRPTWYVCADGVDAQGHPIGGCFDGHTNGPLILFGLLLVAEVIAVVLLAALLPVERRLGVLGLLLALQVVTVMAGVLVSLSGVWPDEIPNPLLY